GLWPENLASTSLAAKIFSQEVDGQGPCRLLPVSGNRCGRLLLCEQKWLFMSADEISEMADRRDRGGGGDDPEESTQHMIERIWESLTEIRTRMDQQAPVPPVAVPPGDGEGVPVAPVPPRVEVPFVAHVPPPVLLAEEPVMQPGHLIRNCPYAREYGYGRGVQQQQPQQFQQPQLHSYTVTYKVVTEFHSYTVKISHSNGNPGVLFVVLPNSRSPLRSGHARGNAGLQRRGEKVSAIACFFERH
ncbi:hypothetical protein Taro_035361, partial [Colocasia esculenta]|nr:hypothetical protein [Colocasia esculenta]